MKKIYNRQSRRLKGYDYGSRGLYFITITTRNRIPLFAQKNGNRLHLTEYGKIVRDEWLTTPILRDNIQLHDFVVMPEHFHGIVEFVFPKKTQKHRAVTFQSPSQTLGSVIRGFKGSTTKKIKVKYYENPQLNPILFPNFNFDKSIWQRSYHDWIIRNRKMYLNISRYIRSNPQVWLEKHRC